MSKIVGFAGKASSGKNTCSNFLVGGELQSLGLIDSFIIGDDGHLYCKTEGMKDKEFIRFDPLSRKKSDKLWMEQNLTEYVKVYSLAGWLKMLAVELFGLPDELVYGNQEQKLQLCDISWEDMPVPFECLSSSNLRNEFKQMKGKMSVRQFLQYLGTDIMRKIRPTIWTDRLLKDIKEDNPKLAIICDVRFMDEDQSLQKEGAKIIRLTRSVSDDKHQSEIDLDNYKEFDAVLDNQNLTIAQQNQQLYHLLKSWDYLEYDMVSE